MPLGLNLTFLQNREKKLHQSPEIYFITHNNSKYTPQTTNITFATRPHNMYH